MLEKNIIVNGLEASHKGVVNPKQISAQIQSILRKDEYAIEGLSHFTTNDSLTIAFDGYKAAPQNQKMHIHVECSFANMKPHAKQIGDVRHPWYEAQATISFTARIIGYKSLHALKKPLSYFVSEMFHRFIFAFKKDPKDEVKKIAYELQDQTYALLKMSDMHGG